MLYLYFRELRYYFVFAFTSKLITYFNILFCKKYNFRKNMWLSVEHETKFTTLGPQTGTNIFFLITFRFVICKYDLKI